MSQQPQTEAEAPTPTPKDDAEALSNLTSEDIAALKALLKPQESAEESDEKDEQKEPPKVQPHPHTIKYAESLKKQMGRGYVPDWDKIAIDKRIEKMETILEFVEKTKSDEKSNNSDHAREGKPPKGIADSKKLKVIGNDYLSLAENFK